MDEMDTCLDRSFDGALYQIPTDHLKWLPWVGANYALTEPKFLIVAESHYVNGKDPVEREKKERENTSNTEFTRRAVYEGAIRKEWPNQTFSNLNRMLLRTDNFQHEKLWKHITYHNIVQRMMDYSREKGPSVADFLAGWQAFTEIVKVLKPDNCLFIGVKAANTFNIAMRALKVEYVRASFGPKIDNARIRHASITIDGKETKLLFIKHASRSSSWDQWNKQITETFPKTLDFLNKAVFSN